MSDEENKIVGTENQEPSQYAEVESDTLSLHTEQRTSPIPVLPQLSVALGILVFVFGVTYVGSAHRGVSW